MRLDNSVSDKVTVVIIYLFIVYLFLKSNLILNGNYTGAFDMSCSMFSNVVCLILRDSDTDSENARGRLFKASLA